MSLVPALPSFLDALLGDHTRLREACPFRRKLRLLYWLRWLAVGGQLISVWVARELLELRFAVEPLVLGIGVLATFNVFTGWRLARPRPVGDIELTAQLVVDLLLFSWLIYFTGGALNPFSHLYILMLVVAATLLPWRHTFALLVLTGVLYTLLIWYRVPLQHPDGEEAITRLHLIGMVFDYAITVVILAGFIGRAVVILQDQERHIARAREREVRDEAVVGMGALAAGAAHELSSPLTTMAVIVNELQREERDPDRRKNLALLDGAIRECKKSLTDLLHAAGHAPAESGGARPFDDCMQELADRCRLLHPTLELTVSIEGEGPPPMVLAETTLRHAILNLLNNAADASPAYVLLEADWNAREVTVRIKDKGPGISQHIAARLGRQPVTTKEKGLGVGFLISNATVERFGGTVRVSNAPEGGACIEVRMPLTSINVERTSTGAEIRNADAKTA